MYDPLDIDKAEGYLAYALRQYKEKNLSKVAAPLAQALYLDPSLVDDPAVRLVAANITEMDADSAIRALVDSARFGQAPRFNGERRRWLPRRRKRTPAQIILLLLVFVAALAVFLGSGSFEYYRLAIQSGRWRDSLHLSDASGVEYYALIPDGSPPVNGWPVLVALHSYGASADVLLPYLADVTHEAGILLIAPNFGEFPYPYSDFTTPAINAMLNEVLSQHRTDPRGVVMFGFVSGGEIAMLYAQEYFGVAGVVTVSALQLHSPPEGDTSIRYLLIYNQSDEILNYNQQVVETFRDEGNDVGLMVIPGFSDTLEDEAVRRTIAFVKELLPD